MRSAPTVAEMRCVVADLGILLKDGLALKAFQGQKVVTRRPMAEGTERKPAEGSTWRECICHLIHPTDTPCPVCDARFGPAVVRGAGTAEVGGRVWIRECWAPVLDPPNGGRAALYRASADHALVIHMAEAGDCWKPSIHMPKWACRTWGRITSITACDLSTIDDFEARLEGFETADQLKAALRAMYPKATRFWRIAWVPIERPEVPNG